MSEFRGILISKISEAATQLRYLPRSLRLVWSAARHWSLLWAALLAVQGLLPVVLVFLFARRTFFQAMVEGAVKG